MQLYTRKYTDRNGHVLTFVDERAAQLAAYPKVAQLRTKLSDAQTAILDFAEKQAAQSGTGHAQVGLKQTLIDAIIEDLRAISRTAKMIDIEIPGTSANFKYPESEAELTIITTARIFQQKASAPALQTEFIGYGMPANFLEDLDHDCDVYEEFVARQTAADQASALALQNLDAAIARSAQAVDQLDAILRNVYAKDKPQIAAWKKAKRLADTKAHRETPEAIAQKEAKAGVTNPDGHAKGNG